MKIKGSKKPDDLVGTDEDDKIMGLGGDDNITAKGGHDTVDAGKGDDKIVIEANTSANVDAGKGNDSVKVNAGALGSTIDLGKGSDTVEIKSSTATGQTFTIIGADSDDAVNFALGQDAYTVTENGAEGYTVVDANGNSYSLSGVSDLTFDGIPYTPSNPVNDAPVVSTPIADQTATANTAYSFQFSATAFTDPDSDALTYTASLANGGALPSWLAFNAATRTFSGTPTALNVGAVSVRVTASDGSLSATDDFTITVGNTPVVTPPGVTAPTFTNGILYLNGPYVYDVVEATGADKLFVTYRGETFTYKLSDITEINTVGSTRVDMNTGGLTPKQITGNVNFTNVTFVEADVAGNNKFEASFDLSDNFSVTGNITVNGSIVDYFKTRWDFVDDTYTYYNEVNAKQAVDVGLEYLAYLANGGDPLTDIVVKFTPDGGDSDLIPQRYQTLHDNLLGNLDENSIMDKFGEGVVGDNSDEHTPQEILAYIQANTPTGWDVLGAIGNILDGRGVFSGDQPDVNGPKHDLVRTWDYAHGLDRPDYITNATNGRVDDAAISGGTEMYFGDGNSPNNWTIERHDGAGIETALKVHFRGGPDILGVPGAGNVVTFDAPQGSGPTASWGTPALWNFDYSIVTGLNGTQTDLDDFDFVLKIDLDASSGTDYMIFNLEGTNGNTPFIARDGNGVVIGASGEHPTSGDGNIATLAQDSINIGFPFLAPKLHDGANPYTIGAAGTFDIQLIAYEHATQNVLSDVHIQVLV